MFNTVALNVNTYGFAVVGRLIWASGRGPSLDPALHTETLVGAGDPDRHVRRPVPYGITVDIRNRVGWNSSTATAAPPATTRPTVPVRVNTRPGWGGIRGIAADADGTIWQMIQNWGGGAIACSTWTTASPA